MNTPMASHNIAAAQSVQLPAEQSLASPPDWQSLTHVVECPLCEYNLYGLTQPRCPECGLDFDWSTVLDPNRQRHPYLFEHHSEGDFGFFIKTLWGGLRARKFWTTLHPVQRSAPMRLIIYAAIIFIFAILPVILAPLTVSAPARGNWVTDTMRFQFMLEYLLDFPLTLLRPFFYGPVYRTLPFLVIAWTLLPFMNYLLLLIFQGTMHRVRVRHHHVLRCIIYSSDILIWSSILLSLLLCADSILHGSLDELLAWLAILLFPLIWITFAWRLTVAYRRYLRFHHAGAAILSVQIIIFLVAIFARLMIRLW